MKVCSSMVYEFHQCNVRRRWWYSYDPKKITVYNIETAIKSKSPTTFAKVNMIRKRVACAPGHARYSFHVMRLARDAIGVPRPPMLTPTSNGFQVSVKVDSSTAAGTLLMIWLVPMAVSNVFFVRIICKKSCTVSMRPKLPETMKKQTKVANSA